MNFCPFCGTKLSDEAIFCPVCGKRNRFESTEDLETGLQEDSSVFPSKDFPTAVNGQNAATRAEYSSPSPEEKNQVFPSNKSSHRMKWSIISIIALLIAVILGLVWIATAEKGGVPRAVLDARRSVVRVIADYSDGFSLGSGFVISNQDRDTYVATNAHVLEGYPEAISIWYGEWEIPAKIFVCEPDKDLCILQCSHLKDAHPLRLSREGASQGAAVYALGFPAAADSLSDTLAHWEDEVTITNGIVSAVRSITAKNQGPTVSLLQINAAINPGNSGGPLFNEKGQVVGINTYNVEDSQGIFGAIHVSELAKIMSEQGIPQSKVLIGWEVILSIVAVGLCLLSVGALLWRYSAKKGRKNEQDNASSAAPPVMYALAEEPPAAEKPERQVKKASRQKKLAFRLCVMVLCIFALFPLTFGGFYIAACNYADKGDFLTASKLLLNQEWMSRFDSSLTSYIDAGLLLTNGNYEQAEPVFFNLKEQNYRDSLCLWCECRYQYALDLAENEIWSQSLTVMASLIPYTYKDAEAQVQKISYNRAESSFYEKGELYEGFQFFKQLVDEGYGPAEENFPKIEAAVYSAAQNAYHIEDYIEAHKLFRCIPQYADTDKYLILIKARESAFLVAHSVLDQMLKKYGTELEPIKYEGEVYSNAKDAVADLIKIFHFENAADLLLAKTDYAQAFLNGTWQTANGKHYFRMNNNGNITSNLPSIALEPYYSIEKGVFWTYGKNVSTRKSSVYTFNLRSPDSMEIYCHKDGSRYTLYRQ